MEKSVEEGGIESREREIPLSWFLAFGTKDGGIKSIAFSDEFPGLEDNKGPMKEWAHRIGNQSLKEASEWIGDPEIGDILTEAERLQKEATGFTPRELHAKKAALLREFRGKKEAPFKVELY
jgi:hypothetical protein